MGMGMRLLPLPYIVIKMLFLPGGFSSAPQLLALAFAFVFGLASVFVCSKTEI